MSGVRLEVLSREAVPGGERLVAVAHLQVDPDDPANQGIVDLDLAPRDDDGLVRCDVDVEVLRPLDVADDRHLLLAEVPNRGMKLILMLGQEWLLRQGWTLVWVGWQGDVTWPGFVGARLPTVTATGPAQAEVVFDDLTSDRLGLPYPAATPDQAEAVLTVHRRGQDPGEVLPPTGWRFDGDRAVQLTRPVGVDAGAVYRFSYLARDPVVMGLGFAATRDVVSWLRHERGEANPLADRAPFAAAVGYGTSQAGRYLRDWLWHGFNRDLAGRPVLDGAMATIPGARRTFTNVRFSQPGAFSRQHEDRWAPGFDFPFTYGDVAHPVTGEVDGILRRATADGVAPKVMHVDSSAELWQAGASLVGTGGTDHDVELPAGVRAYLVAGVPHAPGLVLPFCVNDANPLSYDPVMRALLVAMVRWVVDGVEPPASVWPSVAAGDLVELADLHPPDLSVLGKQWAGVLNRPDGDWPVLVPVVDADGNDLPGIRLPELAVPTGTHLGWNLRGPGHAPGQLATVFGSFIPFAADAASRGADPRPSVAERYDVGELERRRAEVAAELRARGLLLDTSST